MLQFPTFSCSLLVQYRVTSMAGRIVTVKAFYGYNTRADQETFMTGFQHIKV